MADMPINTTEPINPESETFEETAQTADQPVEDSLVQAGAGDEDDWDDEVESFIGEAGTVELPDPNSVVTIRTSGGGDKYVPVTQPTPVKDVIAQSGLFFGGAVQYWLNGAQVNQDTLVPGGSTLSVIGSVKGG